MGLKALSYIRLRTPKLEAWHAFATRLLGMQRVDAGASGASFRMDAQSQRLIVEQERHEGPVLLGWECESRDDLEVLARRLDAHGTRVEAGTGELAARRQVDRLIAFEDPEGNRHEVCWRPHTSPEPFVPGRPISGFRTEPLGMGHAVMHVQDAAKLLPFYCDVLGFRLSDYGMQPYPVYFLHLNARHHSLAMVGSGRVGLHHFMVELQHLDDVGQGYDLAQLEAERVAYTLGRHSNDFMTSFYAHSPSGFYVEYGWGGRDIDPATWQPHETTEGPSLWGHERLAFPPELRERFRQMRLAAAAMGLRAHN